MRMSNLLMPTLREVPAEAEITSHKLMLRAGLIRKLAAGIYSYLPLGLRTLQKVEQIVREEMDNAGAQELLMSALLPAEAYQASGRWEVFGPSMFKMKDRNDRDFCLGPTHEELFTQTVIDSVRSYKEYPMTLYQIQHKYRDEGRPRFGIIRSREFIRTRIALTLRKKDLISHIKKCMTHIAEYSTVLDLISLSLTLTAVLWAAAEVRNLWLSRQ